MDNRNDTELVLRVMQDDQNAFDELYQKYERIVYFMALKMCNSEADAKDVLQETFIQVHKSIKNLKNPDYFRLWLQKITLSKCKNLFRKNQNYQFSFDYDDIDIQNRLIEHHMEFVPQKNMDFTSDQEMLNYFIDRLPNGQKEVLILKYFQQLSIKEIAYVLQIPSGTVKSRISLGKKNLKVFIEDYEKKADMKMSFQSIGLDTLIATALAAQFDVVSIPAGIAGTSLLNTIVSKSLSVLFTTAGKTAVCIVAAMLTIATVSALSEHQGLDKSKIPEAVETVPGDKSEASKEVVPFGPISIDGTTYAKAEDAYITLKRWAHCELELSNMSKEELMTMIPLVNELEKYGGAYSSLLESESWFEMYKKELSKK